MTIQQLTIFLAVCEEMNYTRAAARTYMSRQAVRQNIAELERELNGPLFENYRNHLILTAKGVLLRRKAMPVVESFKDLEQAMAADMRREEPIRLGISNSLFPDYLPELPDCFSSFTASYPNLQVKQLPLNNDDAVAALLEGELDACLIMDLDVCRPGLERTVLTKHPSGIYMKNSISLFARDAISPSDLSGRRVMLPGKGKEFSPLLEAAPEADFIVVPNFYQVMYYIMDHGGLALNRVNPDDDPVPFAARTVPLTNMPPLCSSFLVRQGGLTPPLHLLKDWLHIRLQNQQGVRNT